MLLFLYIYLQFILLEIDEDSNRICAGIVSMWLEKALSFGAER